MLPLYFIPAQINISFLKQIGSSQENASQDLIDLNKKDNEEASGIDYCKTAQGDD